MDIVHNEGLIVKLIQEDLKHHQLTEGLRSIGLEHFGLYNLEIMNMVAELMSMDTENISDTWVDTYGTYMDQAGVFPLKEINPNLKHIAQECYKALKNL